MKNKKKQIHVSDFNCSHVLRFLERCIKCPKNGRCKERGYLKMIVNGKADISYMQK